MKNEGSSPDIQYKKKELKIISSYIIGLQLGKGSYGSVKEGLDDKLHKRVAIKICKEHRLRKIPGGLEHVLEEIKILETLNHPNVIKMYSHWEEPGKLFIVLEYISGGNLNHYIKSLPDKKLSNKHARKIFCGLIEGLEYLHNNGIIHGDIKPENLLLTESGSIKITDFGVSMITHDKNNNDNEKKEEKEESNEAGVFGNTLCGRGQGTVAFQPPEVVSGKIKFAECGPRLDIWASGVVLYIMVIGDYPFKGESIGNLLDSIASVDYNIPNDIDDNLKDLIEQILSKNLENDNFITINDIKSHPWFLGEKSDFDVPTIPTLFEKRKRGGYRLSNTKTNQNCNIM